MVVGMNVGGRSEQSGSESMADLLLRLWRESSGERFGFTYMQFEELMLEVAVSNHWGRDAAAASEAQKTAFLASIRVKELVLARACALGNESAWDAFLLEYREMLYSAAYGIIRQDGLGRELADSLYADLFGLSAPKGYRQSKLTSYTGRGSLAGWLRSVLAQRYVDQYRKAHRLVSIEEQDAELLTASPETSSIDGDLHRKTLADCIGIALRQLAAEDRFLLQAYYLDGRILAEIARLLGLHESTISRRLKRLGNSLRKQILKHLESSGLSRRAAEEALSSDVRDIEVNVRRLLQVAGEESFQEVQATKASPTGKEG
jgi:RNA polymerase sigma-70 factor (ECF subfamily)